MRDEEKTKKPAFNETSNSGQFKKGQSGNPRGRPPSKLPGDELPWAALPTGEALSRAADRMISVKDASGRREIPVRDALSQAHINSGLRGGTLDQHRVYRNLQVQDKQRHQERLEKYEFWRAYKVEALKQIFIAANRGDPEIDIFPHPDDIALNPVTLEVKIHSPRDQKDLAHFLLIQKLQDLSYELSIYMGEVKDDLDFAEPIAEIGIYMACYVYTNIRLPKRFRRGPESYEEAILALAYCGRKSWETDLKARYRDIGGPFPKRSKSNDNPTIQLAHPGLYLEDAFS